MEIETEEQKQARRALNRVKKAYYIAWEARVAILQRVVMEQGLTGGKRMVIGNNDND